MGSDCVSVGWGEESQVGEIGVGVRMSAQVASEASLHSAQPEPAEVAADTFFPAPVQCKPSVGPR
jgi:hypothetical protein